MADRIDPSRIYTALMNTGLQQKDNALYQVIRDLIGTVVTISQQIGSGGGGTINVVNVVNNIAQTLQVLSFLAEDGLDGLDCIPGPVSSGGVASADAFVPYFIATGNTFTIPVNKQGLFSMNIDNEGMLILDGFLIEVD